MSATQRGEKRRQDYLKIIYRGIDAVFGGFDYLYSVNHNLQIDNHTLVEECKRGDKDALNHFYIRFAPLMLSVIRRYVTDPKDAEDILHDGFIIAFTRLDSLRDYNKVDYWLATIMKNLSLQFLQTQDVTTILSDIPEVEDAPEIDDFIDFDTLESLIKRLPTGYQSVFRLAVLENRTHKEIAKLLGIAPNSSSSQLFHAKLMMRKLIVEYKRQSGMLVLLALATTAGVMLWHGNHREDTDLRHPMAENRGTERASENTIPAHPKARAAATIVLGNLAGPAIAAAAYSSGIEEARKDSVVPTNPELIAESSNEAEKDVVKPIEANVADTIPEEPYPAYPDEMIARFDNGNEWAIQVNVNPGIAEFNKSPGYGDTSIDNPPPSNPDNPPSNPDDQQTMTRRAGRSYSDYKNIPHKNHLPLSFSITANKRLTKLLSAEAGITYTYLHTTFETPHAKSDCNWHYIGIPLKLNLTTFTSKRVRLYASFGGEVDIPVYSNAHVTPLNGDSDLGSGQFSSPVVWSLSASYGISISISKRIDIFLEPTLQYHFNPTFEVPNAWTDNPWGFSLPIGFRFKW